MTKQEYKRQWAIARINQLTATGVANPCIVVPEFIEDDNAEGVFVPTSEVAIAGKNPEWCAINVVSVSTSYSGGFKNERYLSALIRMKTTSNNHKAGQHIPGKIYVVESTTPQNPNDLKQGMKFVNADAQANNLPCCIGGEVIYRNAFFTDDMNQSDTLIAHDNDDAIRTKLAEVRAISNKPITNALKDASGKALRIAALKGIAKGKRTPEQVAELADLLED